MRRSITILPMTLIKPFCRFAGIVFFICPAMSFAEVSVKGLSGEAESNVELSLSLSKQSCDAPAWKVRHLFSEADKEIDSAMRAVGYYHAVSRNNLSFDPDCWQAEFDIDAGPRVSIASIDIVLEGEAAEDPVFKTLSQTLKKDAGSSLNHGRYEKMKSQIESLAMERGYFDGRFIEHRLLVDESDNKAKILLKFDSVRRLAFGAIDIDQDILNPEFVAKFINVKTGDSYNSDKLADTYNTLSKSGYFQSIDIHPELDRVDQNRVPIRLRLHPKKAHHYSVGVGFDTDKGPLIGGSYENRRLNKDGHFLNFNIDLSPVFSTADAEYSVPLDNPISDFFSFGGGLKREDTDTYTSLSGKLSARLKHTFDSGWKQTLYVDEIYESFKTDSTSTNTLLLLPGASWLRSVADDAIRPTSGYRLEFDIAATYQNPLSDISMAQATLSGVWTHSFPWDGRIILRGEQGATIIDNFDKLPATYRFYAGGMKSIRGYAYKELGPKDAQGHVVGGRFLSVVSVEYEQKILDNWGVAAFAEGGNAYNLDSISVKTGAGLGVRWYSPIGLVRLDFAVPLDSADSSFQVHFAAGTRL